MIEEVIEEIIDDETLVPQIVDDLTTLFSTYEDYKDIVIKPSYEAYPDITYPIIIVSELENSDNQRFYDGKEHVVNVGYQITIQAEQSETRTAIENVKNIINIIKKYMRGERYHALRRTGPTPITKSQTDDNIRIGYMRYTGCIDIDNHIIYRRS